MVVTGAGGQVGLALRPLLPAGRFLTRDQLDVTDGAAVRSELKGADVVIHLAAMTNVDECERAPARAFEVNAEGTRNVAEASAGHGARVIYVSTDYVFDGTKPVAYEEDDPPAPLNQYGCSKVAGEGHVAAEPGNLIVRSSWIYGQGANFIRTIVGAARRGDPLRVVDDQRGRPTSAEDLAAALAFLVASDVSGVLHVSGDGDPCSWADLAEFAIAAAGLPEPVERIDSATYQGEANRMVARRPSSSVLSLAKAERLGVPLRPWRPSVELYVRTLA